MQRADALTKLAEEFDAKAAACFARDPAGHAIGSVTTCYRSRPQI
jgi:hypothetical protein